MLLNSRAMRFIRRFAFAGVLIAFGLACCEMYEERHDSGWRVPLNDLGSFAKYVVKTVRSGRELWWLMQLSMLVWIAAAVAEKYLRSQQTVDPAAEDYRER